MPISDVLEAACGMPVLVHNNTRAMGFAEFRALRLHQDQPMLLVLARFGLGATIVNSSSPSPHSHYGVSELAYLPLGVNRFSEKVPTPDKHLGRVLTERYLQTILDAAPSDGPVIPILEARCDKGEPIACRLFEQTVENLARGLGVAAGLLRLRVIVLAGIYAHASEKFVEALTVRLCEHAQPEHTRGLGIQRSRLGSIGVVQGGALVAFNHTLTDPNAYGQLD